MSEEIKDGAIPTEKVVESEDGGQPESVVGDLFDRTKEVAIVEVVEEKVKPPVDTPKPDLGEKKKEEVVAVGEDKKEWEKRYKDQQAFLQESRIENRELKKMLVGLGAQVKTLKDVAITHHKELHPDDQFPEPAPPPSDEPAPQSKMLLNRVKESEEMVKEVYGDYEAIVGKSGDDNSPFAQAVTKKPHLLQQVFTAPNPALEAYNIGRDYQNKEKYGHTPEEMRTKIEREVREAIDKEMKQKEKEKKPASPSAPTLRKVASKEGGGDPPTVRPGGGLRQIFGR